MAKRIDMFGIDPENDFLASGNEPADWPWPAGKPCRGALCVEGADKEALLVEEMIDRLADQHVPGGHKITNMRITIDSHPLNDCSHNTSWRKPDGTSPDPFTIVSHDDVKKQLYVPCFPVGKFNGKQVSSYQWALDYTEALAKNGRAPLCLWPRHCLIGTWGQNIYHPIRRALDRWCEVTGRWVDYVVKGQYPFSEHYSAMRADVEDPTEPITQLNVSLLNQANQADIIAWFGWAGSHCLRYTALDAVNYFGAGENGFIKKCVFFEDACAAVGDLPGVKFSEWRKEFLDEVVKRGATVTTTKDFLK